MRLEDLVPLVPGGLGIGMVHSDHIRGKRAAVVDVGLVAGHLAPDEIIAQFGVRVGLENPDEKFVCPGIVIVRFFNRNHVLRDIRQADAVVVGLDTGITLTALLRGRIGNAPEQAALGFSGDDIGIDPVRELVQVQLLIAVPGLPVNAVVFASIGV